jgi:hypothetical protein
MKIRQNGHQNIIFDIMSELLKDSEDDFAGIGNFKKI